MHQKFITVGIRCRPTPWKSFADVRPSGPTRDLKALADYPNYAGCNERPAGKRLRSRTTRKNRWLRRALTEAAWATGRTENRHLKAQYRLRRRAAARSGRWWPLATACW